VVLTVLVVQTHYRFNCWNIGGIALRHKIGHGVTKSVYLGLVAADTADGQQQRPVAVKMVTRKSKDIASCMQQLPAAAGVQDHQRCFIAANMKLMKEILLLNQLRHPALLPLLGYCVRSEETDSTSLQAVLC